MGGKHMPDTIHDTVPYLSADQVEEKAAETLRRHELITVPINPLVLAHLANIEVNNVEFTNSDVAGMIVKRGVDVAIFLNRSDPPFRKRFTIAHELGHYFLHLEEDGEFVDEDANLFRRQPGEGRQMTDDRRREIQANMFAASLLMPAVDVRRYWNERRSVEELARIFKVSSTAMGIRVDSLDLD